MRFCFRELVEDIFNSYCKSLNEEQNKEYIRKIYKKLSDIFLGAHIIINTDGNVKDMCIHILYIFVIWRDKLIISSECVYLFDGELERWVVDEMKIYKDGIEL